MDASGFRGEVTAATLALLVLLAVPAIAQEGGAVAGTVVNSVTRMGIEGVVVTVGYDGAEMPVTTTTDAAGKFRIDALAPRKYRAEFEQPHFCNPRTDDEVSLNFEIPTDGALATFQVEMMPRASLHGRILDGAGRPLANVQLELERVRYPGSDVTDSDKDGQFTFADVRPTEYRLAALPGEARHVGLEDAKVEWVRTYYPGVATAAQSAPILISPGADLKGYEFRLTSAATYQVRGTVIDEAGKPVAEIQVDLISEDGFDSKPVYFTQADGRFLFEHVRSGRWHCVARSGLALRLSWDVQSRDSGNVDALMGSVWVNVGEADMDKVEVRALPPFDIPYEALKDDGSGQELKPSTASLKLESADGVNGGVNPANAGKFTDVFVGRYRVVLNEAEPGYYLASLTQANRNILGEEIELAHGSPTIRAVFESRPGAVNGTVEDTIGATVVLLPCNRSLRGLIPTPTVQVRSDGHFELGDLPPGDYYAWAFERVDLDALQDATFVQRLLKLATAVRVERGASAIVKLSVTPWPD